MSNASEEKDASDDDKPEDVYANEPGYLNMRQKEKKKNKNSKSKLCPGYALFLVWPVFASEIKTTHLSGISFLSTEAKIVPN